MRIFYLIFLIVLSACEGPYNNCEEYYFSDEFKAYTFFEPGSYWVYEDTTYNLFDSTTLISQIVSFEELCNSRTNPHEKVLHKFTSTFFNDPDMAIIEGNAHHQNYNYEKIPPSGYYQKPAIETEANYFVDSIKVNEVWYYDVRIIEDKVTKYYWAKNVGLIKKSMYKDYHFDTLFNFELIRYKLN